MKLWPFHNLPLHLYSNRIPNKIYEISPVIDILHLSYFGLSVQLMYNFSGGKSWNVRSVFCYLFLGRSWYDTNSTKVSEVVHIPLISTYLHYRVRHVFLSLFTARIKDNSKLYQTYKF